MRISPEFLDLKTRFDKAHYPTSCSKFTKIMAEFAKQNGFPDHLKLSTRRRRGHDEIHIQI